LNNIPITLGGTVLPIGALTEETVYAQSKTLQWLSGVCSTKIKTYGAYQIFTISCTEKNVAWGASIVPIFEASIGSTLTFIQTSDPRITVGTVSVKVLDIHSEVFNLTSQQRDITITAVTT
jgi:hypothetical protein